MKRTLQEIVELVVFGLIALLLGTGLLWLLGALFGVVGTVLAWLAGLLWAILRFVVPVALVAGGVVLLVRLAQGRSDSPQVRAPAAPPADTMGDRVAADVTVAVDAAADAIDRSVDAASRAVDESVDAVADAVDQAVDGVSEAVDQAVSDIDLTDAIDDALRTDTDDEARS